MLECRSFLNRNLHLPPQPWGSVLMFLYDGGELSGLKTTINTPLMLSLSKDVQY